jgi:hypothetical protein
MPIIETRDTPNPTWAASGSAPTVPGRLRRNDWKGWLALAWVLWWGSAYAVTVLEARAPRALVWIRSWTAGHG